MSVCFYDDDHHRDDAVSWRSLNPELFSVDPTGKTVRVIGRSVGEGQLLVVTPSGEATAPVTVIAASEFISQC